MKFENCNYFNCINNILFSVIQSFLCGNYFVCNLWIVVSPFLLALQLSCGVKRYVCVITVGLCVLPGNAT